MQNEAENETCRLAARLIMEAAVQKAVVKDDYMRMMQVGVHAPCLLCSCSLLWKGQQMCSAVSCP